MFPFGNRPRGGDPIDFFGRGERVDDPALTEDQVLAQEAAEIHGAWAGTDGLTGVRLTDRLAELGSVALCLSGGGIRSASFGLGVLQSLAARDDAPTDRSVKPTPLLARIDYLSTVSGGGYIGSWLTASIARRGFDVVLDQLRTRAGDQTAPNAIGWLRNHSSYLTPKRGLLSGDTWAGVAIIARNMLLNWLLLLPWLCCALLVPKWLALATSALWYRVETGNPYEYVICAAAALTYCFAQVMILRCLPTYCPVTTRRPNFNRSILPALTASSALSIVWLAGFAEQHPFEAMSLDRFLALGAACGALFHFTAWVMARAWSGNGRYLIGWLLAGAVAGAIAASGLYLYFGPSPLHVDIGDRIICAQFNWQPINECKERAQEIDLDRLPAAPPPQEPRPAAGPVDTPDTLPSSDPLAPELTSDVRHPIVVGVKRVLVAIVIGIPWLLASIVVGQFALVAANSYCGDKAEDERTLDVEREWLARAAGGLVATILAWLCVMMIVTSLGTFLVAPLYNGTWKFANLTLAAVGGLSGLFALVVGVTPRTGALSNNGNRWQTIARIAASFAAPVCALLICALLSSLIDYFLLGRSLIESTLLAHKDSDVEPTDIFVDLQLLTIGLMVLPFAAWVASRAINVNRFSLHALYRNRLVRAFLGGSNPGRAQEADPFIDFATGDNQPIAELWNTHASASKPRMLQVLNIALNTVGGRGLAGQDRKARSFTVSPLHSGVAGLGYRRSEQYCGSGGITIGTAMAISGAAASPNMGYHSSPSVTFLMALFNARLGWWLGNPGAPGKDSYKLAGPRSAIDPIFAELFGLTTADSKYVYLSDGGHFENLGLYEMVRRRCRLIIVSDAGFDPSFQFADLGNAVRRIEIDFGIKIAFKGLDRMANRPAAGSTETTETMRFAVGCIDYGMSNGKPCTGWILYVKPAYLGRDEPVGVRSYALEHDTFPHESTANQWFNEAQFESYRSLGEHTSRTVLRFLALGRPDNGPVDGVELLAGDIVRYFTGLPSDSGRDQAAHLFVT